LDDDAADEPDRADSWLIRGLFGGFGRFVHLRSAAAREASPPLAPADAAVAATAADSEAPELVWHDDPEAIFDAIVDRLPAEPQADPIAATEPGSDWPSVQADDDAARFGFRPGRAAALWERPSRPADAAVDDWEEPAAAADALFGAEPFDDIVVGPELAPDLPRVCRTCRDFRPSESGGRGWCANRWAFSHRRMVDAEDAAPCATSFGNWWLPVDEVWSTAYDISGHGQATPLLDAWLGERRDAEPQRRRS
jgi:hypothetical protein